MCVGGGDVCVYHYVCVCASCSSPEDGDVNNSYSLLSVVEVSLLSSLYEILTLQFYFSL